VRLIGISPKEGTIDPTALIVSALIAGLTVGVTDTARATIQDMYSALKSKLQKTSDENENVQAALDKFEKEPDVKERQENLKENLPKSIEDYTELLKFATTPLEKVTPKGVQFSKYTVIIKRFSGHGSRELCTDTAKYRFTEKSKKERVMAHSRTFKCMESVFIFEKIRSICTGCQAPKHNCTNRLPAGPTFEIIKLK